MANVLSVEKRAQVIALGRLGWSLRRIEEATGVRRETASGYLQAAGVTIRSPGCWGRGAKPANGAEVSTDPAPAKAANEAEVSTDSPPPGPDAPARPSRSPAASACEP